ncbi:hypothetical protein CRG98_000313 [Punica granatum]|uniref:Uncharacterized protein n=1 Tax=Punica granatum TaxID=22663 RepID=A0A2I0LF44_PUNGR|nr:hypothetical protein CRG98_000313 [Punica granatum]
MPGVYAEDSARAGRDVLARHLVTRSVALREVHRTGQETCWNTWRRRGMVKTDLFDVTLAICGCLILPPSMFKSATELPYHSRRKISGGPRMTHEWDSIKIRTPKGHESGGIHAARHLKPLEIGFYNSVDNCGPTDECLVLLDGWHELGTLYVEDGARLGFQNAMAVSRKFQSTCRVASKGISPTNAEM